MQLSDMQLSDVDLADKDNFVPAVPHEMFSVLRREAPVHWQDEPDGRGFWAVTRYPDVVHVNRDVETFSSHKGTALLIDQPAESLEQQRLMMLNMDPPMHTRYRLLVNKGFTPRMIGRLEERIREMTTQIIDDVCEKGECDFVTDIAAELPLQAIAELLGVPPEDRHLVFEWSNRMIGAEDPEYQVAPEAAFEASADLYGYANRLGLEKRANPGDDIVSVLLQAEVDGERLDEMQFDLFFLLLSVAGNETTRNLISHGMHALIEHPEQRQRLLDDPSLLPTGIEEMLRWATPVMSFRRTATHDTELAGQPIAEGDKVVIWYISANRDESVFEEPFRFDVGRSPNDHITFGGGGPHFCLGSHLAKLEIRIMFEELLRRLPDMELDGPVRRLRSNFINGLKHMPVRFTPSPRLAS